MNALLASRRRAASRIAAAALAQTPPSMLLTLAASPVNPFGVHHTHDADGALIIVRVPEIDWESGDPYGDLARSYGIEPIRRLVSCPNCGENLGPALIDGKVFVACLTALNPDPAQRCRWMKEVTTVPTCEAEGKEQTGGVAW